MVAKSTRYGGRGFAHFCLCLRSDIDYALPSVRKTKGNCKEHYTDTMTHEQTYIVNILLELEIRTKSSSHPPKHPLPPKKVTQNICYIVTRDKSNEKNLSSKSIREKRQLMKHRFQISKE